MSQACLNHEIQGCVCDVNRRCFNKKTNKCLDCQDHSIYLSAEGVTCQELGLNESNYTFENETLSKTMTLQKNSYLSKRAAESNNREEFMDGGGLGSSASFRGSLKKSYSENNGPVNPFMFSGKKETPSAGMFGGAEPELEISPFHNCSLTERTPGNSPPFCLVNSLFGCIHYENGKKADGLINICGVCQNSEVVSYTLEETCNGNITLGLPEEQVYRCQPSDREVTKIFGGCKGKIANSCVFYRDGTFDYIETSACDSCRHNFVTAVAENRNCPREGFTYYSSTAASLS